MKSLTPTMKSMLNAMAFANADNRSECEKLLSQSKRTGNQSLSNHSPRPRPARTHQASGQLMLNLLKHA